MNNKKQIQIPAELHQYVWGRYLPETTYKMYLYIGYLTTEKIKGDQATKGLLELNVKVENNIPQVIEEKKRVLESLGFKYPENPKEDLELLVKFNLIKILKDQEGQLVYLYNLPVPKPEEVLNLDEEEKQNLENIKFEIKHQNALSSILTLLINSNGIISSTLDHLLKTTRTKLTDAKRVLEYLSEEGSIIVKGNKEIDKLKKDDKVHISINKEVFEQKRFILGE